MLRCFAPAPNFWMTVEHRLPTEEAWRASSRLQSLVDASPIATIVVDRQLSVELCNPAFERLFRYDRSEVVGFHIDDLIVPSELRGEATELRRRALAGEISRTVTRRRRKDGSLVDVAVSVVPFLVDGAVVGAYGLYEDVSEQRRAERRLRAQHAVAKVLANASTLQEAVPEILRAVGEAAGCEVGAVWRVDADAHVLQCIGVWHATATPAATFLAQTHETTFPMGGDLPGRVWRTGQPAWVPNVVTDPNFRRASAAAADGLRGAFAFPLYQGRKVTGVMEFFSREVREPDQDLLRLFDGVGEQIGQFVERRRAEEELSRFFMLSIDPLCIAGFDGYFKRLNPAWERALGFTLEELLARPYLDLVHPEDQEATFREIEKISTGATRLSFENRFLCKDGSYRWLVWHAVPLPSEGVMYAVARDITLQREAAEELEAALRMKSDFVSFVTHQLRTPLAGVKWMLELADQPEVPAEIRSSIHDARLSADRLIGLVNDLLDVARIEGGKLTVVPQDVDLGVLTRSVADELSPLVKEKQQRFLSAGCEERLPPVVVDPQLIRQVLLNLLSNAIKYTPEGGEIRVRIERRGGQLEWSVRDTGIGVPAAARDRLFEKFYRAENAATTDTEGTGLGLYLVRLILERSGGHTWFESEEGAGSTFGFTLRAGGGMREARHGE